MREPLHVIANHLCHGRNPARTATLVYDDHWRSMDSAYPLSLSIPLVVREHEHAQIEPWLRGLLPDNETILDRWGRHQVSPRNACA